MAFDAAMLKPGDCLLYRPSGIFGWVIRLKTWHRISHVEVYVGNGLSSASRDGIGVNLYPLRTDHLAYVLRPNFSFDPVKARAFTRLWAGTPYGWLDLLDFTGLIKIDKRGIVCSPWATKVYRLFHRIFGSETENVIAPFEFLTSDTFTQVWSDGQPD